MRMRMEGQELSFATSQSASYSTTRKVPTAYETDGMRYIQIRRGYDTIKSTMSRPSTNG